MKFGYAFIAAVVAISLIIVPVQAADDATHVWLLNWLKVWLPQGSWHFNELCLSGDTCITAWPAGGGGGAVGMWIDRGIYLEPNISYAINIQVRNLTVENTTHTEDIVMDGRDIRVSNYGRYGAYNQLRITLDNPTIGGWNDPIITFYSDGTAPHYFYPSTQDVWLGAPNPAYNWEGLGVDTTTINDASITDSTGAIGFGNEDLTTQGTVEADMLNLSGDIINFADGSVLSTSTRLGDGFFGQLDGVDDHAQTDADNWADADNAGTIAAWVRFNETDEYQVIAGYSTAGYGSSNFVFRMDSTSNLTLAWNADTAGWNSIVSSHQITGNNWHHVAAMTDGNKQLEIYLDGVNASHVTWTQGSGGASNDWFIDTYLIGSYNHHLAIGVMDRQIPAHFVNGSIDEVMYFEDRISPTEIAQMYADGRNNGSYQGNSQSDLISHWRANANSADDDLNNNDMTLQSGAVITTELNDTILDYTGLIRADDYLYSSPYYVKDDTRSLFKGMTYKPDSVSIENPDWAEIAHESYGAAHITKNGVDYISTIYMQQLLVKETQDLIVWNEEQGAMIEGLERRIAEIEKCVFSLAGICLIK